MYVIVVSQLAGDPNNLDNNGFAATEVTNALADLRVTSVVPAAPATPALSGEKTSVTYSVENQRSEEHTSELQSLMRISYAVFCLKKTKYRPNTDNNYIQNTHTASNRKSKLPKTKTR